MAKKAIFTVSLEPEVADSLRQLGSGNLSAGIRALAQADRIDDKEHLKSRLAALEKRFKEDSEALRASYDKECKRLAERLKSATSIASDKDTARQQEADALIAEWWGMKAFRGHSDAELWVSHHQASKSGSASISQIQRMQAVRNKLETLGMYKVDMSKEATKTMPFPFSPPN